MGDKEKEQMGGRNDGSDRKYEDVDPAGESILVLSSGLQRAAPKEPPPRHHTEMRDGGLSPKKQCDENVPPPLPAKKPPLCHLDMRDKAKKQVNGRSEESAGKYEDVDPHGESIFALRSGLKAQYDEDVDGRNVPPPLPARNYRHLDMRDKQVDERNEKAERKNEDVDPHGESIFRESKQVGGRYEDVDLVSGNVNVILNSGLKRAVPDVPPPRKLDMGDHAVVWSEQKEESSSEPHCKQEGRDGHKCEEASNKYEDVDIPVESDGADVILNSGLKRAVPDLPPPHKLDMGDHLVLCPEQKGESCSDPYYKPEDTDGDGEQEGKSPGLKIRVRAVEMWNRAKSSKVCWVILGCGVLLIASAVIGAVLSAYIKPGSKETQGYLEHGNVVNMTGSNTSVLEMTVFHEENTLALINATPFSPPLMPKKSSTPSVKTFHKDNNSVLINTTPFSSPLMPKKSSTPSMKTFHKDNNSVLINMTPFSSPLMPKKSSTPSVKTFHKDNNSVLINTTPFSSPLMPKKSSTPSVKTFHKDNNSVLINMTPFSSPLMPKKSSTPSVKTFHKENNSALVNTTPFYEYSIFTVSCSTSVVSPSELESTEAFTSDSLHHGIKPTTVMYLSTTETLSSGLRQTYDVDNMVQFWPLSQARKRTTSLQISSEMPLTRMSGLDFKEIIHVHVGPPWDLGSGVMGHESRIRTGHLVSLITTFGTVRRTVFPCILRAAKNGVIRSGQEENGMTASAAANFLAFARQYKSSIFQLLVDKRYVLVQHVWDLNSGDVRMRQSDEHLKSDPCS
ncbi:Hypp2716 [Branchiostoma lanceolatum]|uniref:Hypp2716 protein n=1 Tax=Branchiostoma lanceolatum TaxID=7740 RepID=A0A8J9ZYI4_BRALA|nr:Hypp2716 [Branchiostoma lanceolatum]